VLSATTAFRQQSEKLVELSTAPTHEQWRKSDDSDDIREDYDHEFGDVSGAARSLQFGYSFHSLEFLGFLFLIYFCRHSASLNESKAIQASLLSASRAVDMVLQQTNALSFSSPVSHSSSRPASHTSTAPASNVNSKANSKFNSKANSKAGSTANSKANSRPASSVNQQSSRPATGKLLSAAAQGVYQDVCLSI
jgi:hypothetical protein